ncbi:hypothetical protein [Hoyosella altamirensis]|uniref:Uncharacterized protein n=1 Tax=Hoyosella altamirensis TaxID=616997 RepID=A0A839RQJ2_9ACTN|nr:hypothetical protein [Hoyosella altamirensis]MBB3038141.1 hypothetical protein [Hoyosella altamirensis]
MIDSPFRHRDIPAILGLRSSAAWSVVVFVVAAYVIVAARSSSVLEYPVVAAVAITAIALGGFAIVFAKSDPLPLRAALPLGAIAPVLALLFSFQLTPGELPHNATWYVNAVTFIVCFTALRGRILIAWISMGMMAAVLTWWGLSHGEGLAFGFWRTAFSANLLLLATILAFTMRPVARTVFALQEGALQRAAEQASTTAILEERDERLQRLNELVRPLLELIASGTELTADEREECRLIEGQLRDSLRARALAVAPIQESAKHARQRGVDVVLLDDGGLTGASAEIVSRVRKAISSVLDDALNGRVTARVLPNGRDVLATILSTSNDFTTRITINRHGETEWNREPTRVSPTL